MERNNREQKELKRAMWRAYYNTTLKHKIYAVMAFALGAVSMSISLTTALLVFIAMFIIPGILNKR